MSSDRGPAGLLWIWDVSTCYCIIARLSFIQLVIKQETQQSDFTVTYDARKSASMGDISKDIPAMTFVLSSPLRLSQDTQVKCISESKAATKVYAVCCTGFLWKFYWNTIILYCTKQKRPALHVKLLDERPSSWCNDLFSLSQLSAYFYYRALLALHSFHRQRKISWSSHHRNMNSTSTVSSPPHRNSLLPLLKWSIVSFFSSFSRYFL